MLILTILVFCAIISTGYLQEFDYNSFPSIDNSERTGWPLQVFYEEPQVQRKPCPHRRSKVQGDGSTVSENLPPEPSPDDESKTATHNDPKVGKDNSERTNRRSNFNNELSNSNEQPFSNEYDCDLDPGADDYFQSQYRNGNYLATSSPTTVGIEQKVIEMPRDCIHKKQKFIKGKINQLEEIPLTGSRRSMGGSDNDDKITPETNKTTIDSVKTITGDKLNDSVPLTDKANVTPAFTLRPGKLFNELQNPAKVTSIADIPATRRMQVENSRVCYACSTATNPSCWEPDKRTTIKYCHDNQHCVTKSFGAKNSLTVLRDCAESCDAPGVAGVIPKYKSCSVCHKDLCNSAVIKSYNLLVILLITAFKCTF